MRFVLLFMLFSVQEVLAMSPFTADSEVITHLLHNDSGLWKVLNGPIHSIKILSRKLNQGSQEPHQEHYRFEVTAEKMAQSSEGKNQVCTLEVEMTITRDFMPVVGKPEIKLGKPNCR